MHWIGSLTKSGVSAQNPTMSVIGMLRQQSFATPPTPDLH